jgi:alpha-1,6-mannosyltransferase
MLFTTGIVSFLNVEGGQESLNAKIFSSFSFPRLFFNAVYLVLLFIYLAWLSQPQRHFPSFSKILKIVSPFLLLSYFAYPFSHDIYSYLQYGWMNLHGINPYLNPPVAYPSVLSPHVYWSYSTSTYGPVSMLIFTLTSLGVFFHPLVGVYIFKLFCLLAHGVNAFLIWRFSKSSTHQTKITMAYILNPALLNAFVADAHVDVFLCTSILVFFLCTSILVFIGYFFLHRYVSAFLAAFAGFLTKLLPIIWLPLIAGFLIRQRRWKELGIATVGCLVIVIVLSQTWLPTLDAWRSLSNQSTSYLTARSWQHFVSVGAEKLLGITVESKIALLITLKQIGYAIFLGFYLSRFIRLFSRLDYDEEHLVIDAGWVLVALFLFGAPWFMSWYTSILFAIALLTFTRSPFFALVALTFCLSPNLVYGTGSADSLLGMVTALSTILPPIVALLWGKPILKWIVLNYQQKYMLEE